MTTNARKTDAQRLGNGKKAFNVKQVEKMIEQGGGTEYTAGTGIVIADDTISVDEQTVAMKSELPDMTQYQEKLTAISPIDITSFNISLKDFHIISMDKYKDCFEPYDNKNRRITLKKDIVIDMAYQGAMYGSASKSMLYLPKGFVTHGDESFSFIIKEYGYAASISLGLQQLLSPTTPSTVTINKEYTRIYESNGIIHIYNNSSNVTLDCKSTLNTGNSSLNEFRIFTRE